MKNDDKIIFKFTKSCSPTGEVPAVYDGKCLWDTWVFSLKSVCERAMDGERYVTEQDEQAYVKRCEKLEKTQKQCKNAQINTCQNA